MSTERVKELEAVLAEALDYIEGVTVFEPPGSRGVDIALKLGSILSKGEKRIDSHGTMKCRNLDCWLCHGTPANAGPR